VSATRHLERSHSRIDMAPSAMVPIARTIQPNTIRELHTTDVALVVYSIRATSCLVVVSFLAVISMVVQVRLSKAELLYQAMLSW
jgi:hypothetical protein